GLREGAAVGEVGVEEVRVEIKVVVNRMVDPRVVLAAVGEVERGDAQVLEEWRVVRSRSERANAPVGARADFFLVLRLCTIDRTRLMTLPHADVRLRIRDVARDVVDEVLERMRALRFEEAASVAVGVDVRDGVLLQLRRVRFGPFGRAEKR